VPGPAVEDETQVASESAALGLNLSERQPRIYGEGNWEARVVIKAKTESWIQVLSRDGDLLLTRVLRPGDQYLVPNRSNLFLMTGNAGGIEIIVDGKSVPAIGRPGVVRDNVALVPERLIAGTAVDQ
jgi:cytoskeleton protein RodZ